MANLLNKLTRIFYKKRALLKLPPKRAAYLTAIDIKSVPIPESKVPYPEYRVFIESIYVTHVGERLGLPYPATNIWIDCGNSNLVVVKHRFDDVVAWLHGCL